MSVHNYAKVFLLKALIAIHKFDIICISEKYLDFNTTSDENNLEIYLGTIKMGILSSLDKHLMTSLGREPF